MFFKVATLVKRRLSKNPSCEDESDSLKLPVCIDARDAFRSPVRPQLLLAPASVSVTDRNDGEDDASAGLNNRRNETPSLAERRGASTSNVQLISLIDDTNKMTNRRIDLRLDLSGNAVQSPFTKGGSRSAPVEPVVSYMHFVN